MATAEEQADETEAAPAAPGTTGAGVRSPDAKDSDFIARPGFRSPGNVRSKAQKKGKKKR